jgi:hypothetical protein
LDYQESTFLKRVLKSEGSLSKLITEGHLQILKYAISASLKHTSLQLWQEAPSSPGFTVRKHYPCTMPARLEVNFCKQTQKTIVPYSWPVQFREVAFHAVICRSSAWSTTVSSHNVTKPGISVASACGLLLRRPQL